MTRPRYEVPIDRANEYAAISQLAARWDLFIEPRDANTGLTLLRERNGTAALFVETKCRNIPSYQYRSLKISTRKVAHAADVWNKSQLPTVLLVRFTDRLMFTKLYPLKTPFPVCVWGRADRGDPQDIENAVEISIAKFKDV